MLLFLALLAAVATVVISAATYPCDNEEWSYYNGYCYWSSLYHSNVGNHRNNWYGAARECRKKNSDLVSIHSSGENHFVYRLSRCGDTWTGLMVTNSANRGSHSGYEWLDGTPRNYLSWHPGYPNTRYHDCVSIYSASKNGDWTTHQHCGNFRTYYVCKKQATGTALNTTQTFQKVRGPCPRNWFVLGKKCYHINITKIDYFAALLQCQSLNSQLVTLHSSKDEADLGRIFDACETPWIGLENTDPNKIGENAGWRWADNTVLDHSNWRDGGIRKDHTRQCGLLQRGSKWDNIFCWELHPFVCEKPNPATST